MLRDATVAKGSSSKPPSVRWLGTAPGESWACKIGPTASLGKKGTVSNTILILCWKLPPLSRAMVDPQVVRDGFRRDWACKIGPTRALGKRGYLVSNTHIPS